MVSWWPKWSACTSRITYTFTALCHMVKYMQWKTCLFCNLYSEWLSHLTATLYNATPYPLVFVCIKALRQTCIDFEQISCCLVTPSQYFTVFSTSLIHRYILLEWVSLSSTIISIPVYYWNLGCSWLLCAHTSIHPIRMGFPLEYDHLYLGAIRT